MPDSLLFRETEQIAKNVGLSTGIDHKSPGTETVEPEDIPGVTIRESA